MSAEFPIVASPNAPITEANTARPTAWAPEPEEAPESGSPMARVVGAVLRYKWLTLALLIVGGIGGVVATRYVQPEYEARATLWVMSPNPTKSPSGPIRAEELLPQSSWVELFQSFVITDS